jgi:hypothetical protein
MVAEWTEIEAHWDWGRGGWWMRHRKSIASFFQGICLDAATSRQRLSRRARYLL